MKKAKTIRSQIHRFHELVALRLAGTISTAQLAELKAIETSFDECERKSLESLAFRRWLRNLDRCQDRFSSRLDAIEAACED